MIALLAISSCGNNDVTPLQTKENCITISRSQIKAWFQADWHTPGNTNFIPLLYFEPYQGPGSNIINVDVSPTDKDTYIKHAKKVAMKISAPCSFPAGLQVFPNYFKFEKKDFADENGKLIKFDFLRLIPKICPKDSTKLSFEVQIVNASGGKEVPTAKGQSWPCPPYCCPGPNCPYN